MLWRINDPASSDNCEAEAISIFERYHLFTKDELIASIEFELEYMQKKEGQVEGYSKEKLELYNKFLSTVKNSELPDLPPDKWLYYEYNFVGNGIALKFCEVEEIVFYEDELNSITITEIEDALFVSCEYLSIQEFAQLQGVKESTVVRWVKTGKLKNAKLDEGKWLIPSVEEKPQRGRMYADYLLEPGLHLDEFPFAQLSDNIEIIGDKYDKSKCRCSFKNYENDFHEEMILSKKDAERLEFLLISSGKARFIDYM
jgi:excisionase family DNA binding protein